MEEGTEGFQRVALPLRCAWCGMIKVGKIWTPDRRGPGEALHSDGICPKCRVSFFLDCPPREYKPGGRESA